MVKKHECRIVIISIIVRRPSVATRCVLPSLDACREASSRAVTPEEIPSDQAYLPQVCPEQAA